MGRIAAMLPNVAALGGLSPLVLLDRSGSAICDRTGNTIQARA
jgi:hypothetical protein